MGEKGLLPRKLIDSRGQGGGSICWTLSDPRELLTALAAVRFPRRRDLCCDSEGANETLLRLEQPGGKKKKRMAKYTTPKLQCAPLNLILCSAGAIERWLGFHGGTISDAS